jgi:hypothetical protein
MIAIIPLLIVVGLVLVVVVAIQRSMKKGEEKGNGADIVSYLVLALAMGVAGFALAELADTAFPGDRFVFDPTEGLATSLSALVVSVPFLIYFWRRQAQRRVIYPNAAGWAIYLALMELVFTTAFIVTAVLFVNGLLTDETASAWTGAVVFGGIVAFHELAARRTPPRSDAGELRRVIGSALGLIAATIGVTGTVAALIDLGLDVSDIGFHPWLAMAIVGSPIWAYRWLKQWENEAGVPRLTWTIIVSIGSLAMATGAATAIAIQSLQYLFDDTSPARQHFDALPVELSLLMAAVPIWVVHRRGLGHEQDNPLRVYEYGMSAIGLVGSVAAAVALTLVALDRSQIVGGGIGDVITFASVLVVSLVLWRFFSRRHLKGEPEFESTAWPRRIYNLGLGVIFGLVAASSLITTLFILLRRILQSDESGSLLEPITLFVYSGLATWYLLAAYAHDRTALEAEDVIAPFDVTIVCSHPGRLAAILSRLAQVIHRRTVGLSTTRWQRACGSGNKPSIV